MKKQNHIQTMQRTTLMAGFSDTCLLTIAHFTEGHNEADEALRDAAGQELFERGLTTAPRYSVDVVNQQKLREPAGGFSNWGDELYNAVTGDDDTNQGHFYRKVLRMEPPVFPEAKIPVKKAGGQQ